jgi:protein-disulfide isomerase
VKPRAQFLTAVTAVLLLGAAAIAAAFLFTRPQAFATTKADSYAGQPTLGDPNAPVKLVLFENFMCDHCRSCETEVFPQLKRDYIDTGRVEAYYVNLAWGSEQAELGGLAGECAYAQDEAAFWTYKRLFYEQQGSWQDASDLAALADEVPELDSERLEACVSEGDTRGEVERDLALGDFVGVQGTPSVVVGDQGLEAPSFEVLQQAIEAQRVGN